MRRGHTAGVLDCSSSDDRDAGCSQQGYRLVGREFTLQLRTVSLPKTANPEHMRSNAQVDFEIAEADMVTLKGLHARDYGASGAFPTGVPDMSVESPIGPGSAGNAWAYLDPAAESMTPLRCADRIGAICTGAPVMTERMRRASQRLIRSRARSVAAEIPQASRASASPRAICCCTGDWSTSVARAGSS